MKKTVLIITVIIIAVAVIILSSCEKNPEKLTIEQSGDIVQTYFQETYGVKVTVNSIEYRQVGAHRYRNYITVTDGETEYILFLDERNKPLLDNFAAMETIKTIDPYLYEDKLNALGLKPHAENELKAIFEHLGVPFSVRFTVYTEGLPSKDAKDGIYSLLTELKSEGIDKLYICVYTPDFLLPSIYDKNGVFLQGVLIETDVSRARFEKQYNDFVKSVRWDQQKFDDKILELTQLGYRKVSFYIVSNHFRRTVEIVLYCESDSTVSGEAAEILLEDMDDSYFKIEKLETMYTLRHIKKYEKG